MRCGQCRVEAASIDFSPRQSQCKRCRAANARAAYGPSDRSRISQRRALLKQIINDAKSVPCMDCRGAYPPVVMDFDHVGEDKLDEVSRLYARGVAARVLLAEIAKCDVVCANCHRLRTLARGQYYSASRAVVVTAPSLFSELF